MPTFLGEGVVSKETVVLRRWGSSIQKFGFINGVDNVNWPPILSTPLIKPTFLGPGKFSFRHAQFNYNQERLRDFGGE